MAPLYVALVHHPVLNRKGETIASAVTNLDLHDLARSARTYEIPACFIVTPLKDQQTLVARLLSHWCEGVGKELHPDRDEALKRLRVVESISCACKEIEAEWGCPPVVWGTTAREYNGAMSHGQARRKLAESSAPCLLLFGTGWGLAPSVLRDADGVLEAIRGVNGYNHLSVRCAAAILMDRLLHGC
jgi:hypothetical protein